MGCLENLARDQPKFEHRGRAALVGTHLQVEC